MALQRRGGYTQDGPADLTDNTLINPVMGGNLGGAAGGLGGPAGAGTVPTPDPGAAPGAPGSPGAPPPGILGPGGNSDSPREQNPGAANPNVSRVSPGGGGGGAMGTPPMPSSPDPVSSQPPSPFQPIAPGMSDQASATPDVGRVNPFGGPSMAGSGLYGKAGGLLGGGLGVPGTNPDHGNDPSNNPDILTLLKLLGAGGQ